MRFVLLFFLTLSLFLAIIIPVNAEDEEIGYTPESKEEDGFDGMGAAFHPEPLDPDADSIREVREYIVGSMYRPVGSFMPNEIDPTFFATGTNVSVDDSFTRVMVFLSAGFSGGSNSVLNVNTEINGVPIANLGSCLTSNLVLSSGGSSTSPSRGGGYTELRCDIPLRQEPFWLNFTLSSSSGVATPTIGFTVYNTEVYTLAGDKMEPLVEQTITYLWTIGIMAFFLLLAEWKRDAIYYLLVIITAIATVLTKPEFIPELIRGPLIAIIPYAAFRAYQSFSDANTIPTSKV